MTSLDRYLIGRPIKAKSTFACLQYVQAMTAPETVDFDYDAHIANLIARR
jgi:hypothetical protein